MADRDDIARAVMDQMRRDDDVRFAEMAALRDQEHQRSLGAAGRPDPNAMPFIRPQSLTPGFPAEAYQDARYSGLPKQYAIEATHEEMRNAPYTWGWGDLPEEVPGS